MTKRLLSLLLFLALAGVNTTLFADEEEGDDGEKADKVVLCHKGFRTIEVGAYGLEDHLGHGDVEGACDPEVHPGNPQGPKDRNGMVAVVMMQCTVVEDGFDITAFSSSAVFSDPALSDIGTGDDCADSLAAFLNNGFQLRSVTDTTYLLMGKAPQS